MKRRDADLDHGCSPVIETGPYPHGRWLWRWATLSRILGRARLRLELPSEGPDQRIRLRFVATGTARRCSFDLPVGPGGVAALAVAGITLDRGRSNLAEARAIESWLVPIDESGRPLASPGVPLGYSSEHARPANRGAIWWSSDELDRLAALAGIEIVDVTAPQVAPVPPDALPGGSVVGDPARWAEGLLAVIALSVSVLILAIVATVAVLLPEIGASSVWAAPALIAVGAWTGYERILIHVGGAEADRVYAPTRAADSVEGRPSDESPHRGTDP